MCPSGRLHEERRTDGTPRLSRENLRTTGEPARDRVVCVEKRSLRASMAQPFSNLQPLSTACDHHLPCNIETVAWGYFCAAREPQAIIESGSTISVDTVSMPLNGNLERGLPTTAEGCLPCEPHTPPEILDIHKNVQKGEGPHVLTGPIAVRGAEAGDVLSISILEVALRSNWAWTFSKPFGGALGSATPLHIRHTKLEPASGRQCGVGRPWWGGQLDLALLWHSWHGARR